MSLGKDRAKDEEDFEDEEITIKNDEEIANEEEEDLREEQWQENRYHQQQKQKYKGGCTMERLPTIGVLKRLMQLW